MYLNTVPHCLKTTSTTYQNDLNCCPPVCLSIGLSSPGKQFNQQTSDHACKITPACSNKLGDRYANRRFIDVMYM